MSFILLGILNSQAAGAVGGGTYDLLETTVLGSDTASVSFTGLGSYSDYKHLQIRAVARSDDSGSSNLRDLRIQANNDTGANYAGHVLRGDGSSVLSNAASSQTSVATSLPMLPRPSNPVTQFGAAIIDVLDFADTSKNTTFRFLAGAKPDGEDQIFLASGGYFNTNALTEIKLFANSGGFGSNSRFSLYGIKAA